MTTTVISGAPGLGETQRTLLEILKRRGELTLGEIHTHLGLSAGTLREHLNALGSRNLVMRLGTRRLGPGRPEVVYGLAPAAHDLFPNRDGRLLAELIHYLSASGHTDTLERFFEHRVEGRRKAALARVAGKRGRERAREVAGILTEEGFMAEVKDTEDGRTVLSLCHCPLKDAVAMSALPCKAEIALVEELVGEPLSRTSYIPNGDPSCSYELSV